MREYISYKQVKAAAQIVYIDTDGTVCLDDEASFSSLDFSKFHRTDYEPMVGDYLVEYNNNYKSVSPHKEFVEGYREITKHTKFTFTVNDGREETLIVKTEDFRVAVAAIPAMFGIAEDQYPLIIKIWNKKLSLEETPRYYEISKQFDAVAYHLPLYSASLIP